MSKGGIEYMSINVTKTYLPDRSKYDKYIDEIYKNGWITNDGPLVKELTERLETYLGVKNLLLVANGTLALQVAYRALGLHGEAITTPFSFVATTSSLVWEGIHPVFSDIDEHTLCMDPSLIEQKITDNTTGIVPVHVFGNACEIEDILEIADKHQLKVVFDAAHAFGVKYKDKSILSYGDASVLSFHATKLFHTIEGGAIVFKDREAYEKAKRLINFGIEGPEVITGLGINCKMNEFEAAMGLCILDDIEDILKKREIVWTKYFDALSRRDLLRMAKKNIAATYNYSYFPIIFSDEELLRKAKIELEKEEIHPRRYFFPSLDTLGYLNQKVAEKCAIADSISKSILCLPLYETLTTDDQEKICNIILNIV
jgi:dTDP-4-amino-4,6-dideoxygalactose transaminase